MRNQDVIITHETKTMKIMQKINLKKNNFNIDIQDYQFVLNSSHANYYFFFTYCDRLTVIIS